MQQELVYFQQKLDAFGIKLPKSMIDQVREDRLNNVGNRRGAGAAIIEFGPKLSTPNLPMSMSVRERVTRTNLCRQWALDLAFAQLSGMGVRKWTFKKFS